MTINEIITNYNAAKDAEREAKKRAEEMKALIIEHAKGAELFTTDVYTVTIKTTTSERLDTKALYKDFPDIKKTYGKTTTSKSVEALVTANAEKRSA